jgi:hypothetical protein
LKFHFNAFTWDHVFPTVACIFAKLLESYSKVAPLLILMTAFIISVAHLSIFAYTVINQIATHLQIKVFRIKNKQSEYNAPT